MGEMISPTSPCFSTTVPSKGARMCIWYLRVYSISLMFAFIILIAASSDATRAVHILPDRRRLLEIFLRDHLLGHEPLGPIGFALLLPEVGLGLLEVGLGLLQAGLPLLDHGQSGRGAR